MTNIGWTFGLRVTTSTFMAARQGIEDLEDQARRIEMVRHESVAHVLDDVAVVEITARDVDGHTQTATMGDVALQARHVRTCAAENPLRHRHDLPGLFGERDELIGRDQVAQRVVPPEEGFDALGVKALVQPYQSSVDEDGELALVYFGGVTASQAIFRALTGQGRRGAPDPDARRAPLELLNGLDFAGEDVGDGHVLYAPLACPRLTA